ncbi:CBD9-like protein [Coniochaeta ligniaria NRRL 30616]|uniref:CBD9-like protein n=1 Tax=Coniochaeta ligniaria NRRL 30616 TaxID=1408157 RepID=A0A1J7IBA8_9PEZI|nr:CBD9-like protein [Coniochaeta ligniaria NRRL 30616]
MRWLTSAVGVAALLGAASAQDPDSKQVVDAETGFTFGQYVSDQGISFRIAIPDPAPATGSYDAVVQIAAPIAIGWAGIAWGGSMTYNPLTIVWKSGTDVVLSSRFAFGYYVPPAYTGAVYSILKTGTHVNATHWQITAKCTGCTQWGDDDIGVTTLDPTQQNPLAFAFSTVPPDTPSSNTSSFGIHDSIGHWYHDFAQGTNPGFTALVSKNSEGPGSSNATTTATGGSTGKPTNSTLTPPRPTTVTSKTSSFTSVTLTPTGNSTTTSSKPTPPKPTKPTGPPKPSRPPKPTKTLKPTAPVKPPHSPPFPFPVWTPKPKPTAKTPV